MTPTKTADRCHLPAELSLAADAVESIRSYNDLEYGGAEGICLGLSAFVSYMLQDLGIGHKLANGFYRDGDGEHPHWWIETTSGWILDGSRGQFSAPETGSLPSVVTRMDEHYILRNSWDPGHSSMELVGAEIRRCFGDPFEAQDYLISCEELWAAAEEASR